MWAKLLTGFSLLSVFHASLVVAQQSQFRVGPVYTDRAAEVSVVVELPQGVAAPDASNFSLILDGKALAVAKEIKPFKKSGRKLALVLCVDVSGTMKKKKKGGPDPLADTQTALLSFLGKVRTQDRIALISFADEDKMKSSFDKTRKDLTEAVRRLQSEGSTTRLYQALYNALGQLRGAKPKLRRVLIISDGHDEKSLENFKAVKDKANTLGIAIDAVGHGRIDRNWTDILNGLADATGGRFVHARHLGELTAALNGFYSSLMEKPAVVYFRFKKDDAGQTTENAVIQLQLPGQAPYSDQISEVIPIPEVRSNLRLYLLLSIFLVLCIGLFIWIRHIFKEDKPKPGVNDLLEEKPAEPPVEDTSDTELPPPDTAVREPHPKATKVGGYFPAGSESERPAFRLVGISGPAEGRQADIAEDIFNIGADPGNDLDLTEDDYVSGQHASIRYEGGNFLIFDDGSSNGTFVNQSDVTSGGFVLNNGDVITIGRSTFEVVTPSK